MTENVTLWLPYTPPSLNTLMYAHWRKTQREKQKLQRDIEAQLMISGLARGLTRVEAYGVLTFSRNLRRDEGNFRMLLEKCLGDALTNGRWLPDDTPEHYTFKSAELRVRRGEESTALVLTAIGKD